MKRLAPLLLLSCMLFAAAPLAAKDTQPSQFKSIVVKHFTNANGTNQSQDFINSFCNAMVEQLQKIKMANQVVAEGVPVDAANAADSIVIEGKFTEFNKGTFSIGKLGVEINLYRVSDGALVKTISTIIPFKSSFLNKDQNASEDTGHRTAYVIKQTLKNVSMSSIPPAPPGANPVTPSTGTAATQPSATVQPESAATVQLSSDPTGAEITVDGNYQGSTPSRIKLVPGTHAIKIAKNGYMPWVRSVDIGPGESRNFIANLEKASQ